MRFMMMYKPVKDQESGPPCEEDVSEMGKFVEESYKSGALLSTEGLQPPSKGARVRLAGGKITVTDGPFAEAKELVGGFAIVRLNSKQEAIEMAKRFLDVAGDGETEIRQLWEPSDFPA